ncbi:MAG: mechanosensitive ion channel [Burkholderiales bacterium]|jgi:small-conductance mechanosensitive channel|nr:mechanosensitive ion channel [Burkholderiales bacterium]
MDWTGLMFKRFRLPAFALALLLLMAGAVGAASPAPEPATLTVLNREVITMRGMVAGATPARRVEQARARIREIRPADIDDPITIVAAQLGEAHGVQFFLGARLLFSAMEDDVDPESQQSFDALVKQTQERLEAVRAAWHQTQDRPLLLRSLLVSAIGTAVFLLLVWTAYRGGLWVLKWLQQWRDRMAARYQHVDLGEFVARVVVGILQLVQWLLIAALSYAWIRFLLGNFVVTAPVADGLDRWLWEKLVWLVDGFFHSLPGVVTIVIILAITRAIADAVGYLLDAIHQGRLKLPLVHPETTTATRRILSLLVWGLGIAVAYPYLPGSESDAFKGLSVLFGLMLTLGSTSLVAQAMSGLVIVYSRALRKGDFVEVGEVQGVVTEVASLATKIVNVRNEEITIPNSVLISSPIRNYSKLAGTQGTLLTAKVTIGYDAPWRQVHALLIEAAGKTPSVRQSPAPFVYQRALSDFYVEYELYVSIDRPLERIPILSALHANIQDAFNEHGVQIMSPHFFAQPANAVVVPRPQWFAPPAQPPE